MRFDPPKTKGPKSPPGPYITLEAMQHLVTIRSVVWPFSTDGLKRGMVA